MARKYKATIDTPAGPRTCLQVRTERGEGRKPLLAQFGGIPLTPQNNTILTDRDPVPATGRKELITRLLIGRCEMCGHTGRITVHHIRKLADLDKPGQPERPTWMTLMAKRRRKTLVVCHACHTIIHTGQPPATPTQ